MQIQTTVRRYATYTLERLTLRRLTILLEWMEFSYVAGKKCKKVQTVLENSLAVSYEVKYVLNHMTHRFHIYVFIQEK